MKQPVAVEERPLSRFRIALDEAEISGRSLAANDLPDAIGALERLRSILDSARLEAAMRPSREEARSDQLLDADEAAARLAVSKSWLYREASNLPFTVRNGRAVRFSQRGIDDYVRHRGRASGPR